MSHFTVNRGTYNVTTPMAAAGVGHKTASPEYFMTNNAESMTKLDE